MKRLSFILFFMFSFLVYPYRVKESPVSRFDINNFKEEIKKMSFDFEEFGNIKDYGILGYYNFVPLKKKGKIIGYACLTHLKIYDRHEPLLVIISLDGKILDYSVPEIRKKHLPLISKSVKKNIIGKDKSTVFMDSIAGSTFSVSAINAEFKNILNIFDYKKEIIRNDE